MALATARLAHPCCMVSNNPRTPPTMQLLSHKPLTTALTLTTSSRFSLRSLDVSKDDKPLEAEVTTATAVESNQEGGEAEPLLELEQMEDAGPKVDPRRFEEQFAVINTGVYECRSCGYLYDQAAGDPAYPVPPGLPFAKLPDDWRCPTCGAAQSFFASKSVEIAGFEQNQQFGLGGNSLTGDQKALIIYGSLLVGFMFFLSGYFLQ